MAVVLSLTSLAIVAPSGAHASAQVHVDQWNVDAWTPGNRDARVWVYTTEINGSSPLFGSANEMCLNDMLRVVDYTGYGATYVSVYDDAPGRSDCWTSAKNVYHNVIFWLRTLTYVNGAVFRFRDPSGPGSPDSPRAVLCVKVAFIMSVSTGCTAHMSPSSEYPSTNEAQINYMGFMGTAWSNGSARLYFMGDWNRSHNHPVLDKFYNSYYEAQPRSVKTRTTRQCSGGGVIGPYGIDFAFGNKAGNAASGSGGVRQNTDAAGISDHCMVFRTFG